MSIWRHFPFRKAFSSVHNPLECSVLFVPSSSWLSASSAVTSFASCRSFVEGPMAADHGTLTADRVAEVLRIKFSGTDGSTVDVKDTSGGCGAMFHVRVESPQFNGVTRVNQHKLINEVLRSEIKNMHGITIETKAMDINAARE